MWSACALLVIANTINIAADLSGMAEATALVTKLPGALFLPVYASVIIGALVWTSYRTIARMFKWLTLVLGAYVLTAFLTSVDWHTAFQMTLLPHLEFTRDFLAVLVGVFGTTISPYLFLWQTAEEVEEESAMGRNFRERQGATSDELRACRTDVVTGMFISNVIMYFIILTTAATLHTRGPSYITTAREAAEALSDEVWVLDDVGRMGDHAGYEDLAIGLRGDGIDFVVYPSIEGISHAAGGIKPGQVIVDLFIDGGELAAG